MSSEFRPEGYPLMPVCCIEVPEGRETLKSADVVLAVDVMSRATQVLRGEELLRRVVATGQTEKMKVLGVELDMNTAELEYVAAALRVLHGEGGAE